MLRILFGLVSLTPPEILPQRSSAFSGPTKCHHFPQKWVPERCHFKISQPPIKATQWKKSKSGIRDDIVSRRTAALQHSSPFSTPSRFHSSYGPRFGTITWPNPASGPEFFSPLNPLHPEALSMPHFISPQPPISRAGTCSTPMNSASSLSHSPSSPRHSRSLGLKTWCHSSSGSTR